ncbi:uncharacterized protein LOC116248385 isoform X2 [Nymphaea colorata]|uniref:uncharacterized protein LOC116248385 isoform X2 n=1 Tax=Nymphaea colorata TaxID=210225 RepID=UPI00214EBA16|nr:uncharacterized protein LOC116248385 isoform X2 [Nymphaea colorata]
MAGTSAASSSSLSIGDCEVKVEGDAFAFEHNSDVLEISVPSASTIKVSVQKTKQCSSRNRGRGRSGVLSTPKGSDSVTKTGKELPAACQDYSFVVLNPKDADRSGKLLLQDVLKVYKKELPSMKYAANTGKESQFLERCVFGGKYCTLLLRSNAVNVTGGVIAAVSYQIIFPDTQFAEVPVVAVCSDYQHKGIGCLLYVELRKRLQNIGVSTLFCWGDRESEGFWLKQGFVTIAEVDTKGKGRKLPIKADIRRALSFPGDSILMVSHLNKGKIDNAFPPKIVRVRGKQGLPSIQTEELITKSPPSDAFETGLCDDSSKHSVQENKDAANPANMQLERSNADHFRDMKYVDASPGDTKVKSVEDSSKDALINQHCSCSGLKSKRAWEASCSSLNSKRVKGHHFDCSLIPHKGLNFEDSGKSKADYCREMHINGAVSVIPHDCDEESGYLDGRVDGTEDVKVSLLQSEVQNPVLMLMNIADEFKKTQLTEIIRGLHGSVSAYGNACTHVVTGKARSTLNFCTALCSGAWIVSSSWLKASVREGMFVEELPFILEDEDYLSIYKSELKDTVLRARRNPHGLLKGYDLYLSPNVQPPVIMLSEIIKSAGGKVLLSLDEVQEPSGTIVVTCEDDMEEALLAVKRGIWTYSSDWFINCIMRQELDFDAPQFAESL